MNRPFDRRTFTRMALASGVSATLWKERASAAVDRNLLKALPSPILLKGDAATAFRDPAAVYHDGCFYLFFTLMTKHADGLFYSQLALSKSRDLRSWTAPRTLTPADKSLEYGSPGDVVRDGKQWVLCLQTYPRPHGERYGDRDSRLWTMRSDDLENWSTPELLKVKGDAVSREAMGRMIDPYLLRDRSRPDVWWCFYKQNGISLSRSNDLVHWEYVTKVDAGENPCVLVDGQEYVLFHSPPNGIGLKRSTDLMHWKDEGVTYLGQAAWPWAQGRITAGFALDLRREAKIGKVLLFFHASRFSEEDPRGGFDNFASIGLAWSDDLKQWDWPAERGATC